MRALRRRPEKQNGRLAYVGNITFMRDVNKIFEGVMTTASDVGEICTKRIVLLGAIDSRTETTDVGRVDTQIEKMLALFSSPYSCC